ncbi:hypothetical protein ACTXT7_013421 [Hymenolepis weldensis]
MREEAGRGIESSAEVQKASVPNYRWWWRSFLSGGSATIYVFCYAVHYYIFKTQYKGFTSGFLYLTCSALVSSLLFIMLGSVGFLSCFLFTRKIYGVVKVD